MAVFKLGTIITDITGSIGGTTFVRGSQSVYMQNKSRGASRSQLFKNIQLPAIASIFQKWKILTETQRNNWYSAALLFQFPDKFGVMRNITGRQLFTKLNVQALPANFSVIDAVGINSELPDYTISIEDVDLNAGDYLINITNTGDDCLFLISVQQKQSTIYSPLYTRRQVVKYLTISGFETVNIFAEILNKFPYFNVNYSATIYVTAINSYGFKSVPKSVIYNP